MEKLNFSHLISLIIGVLVPLIIWGSTVETRLNKVQLNKEEIITIKTDIKENQKSNQENFDEVLKALQDIQLQLKDKVDRK